MTIKQPFYPHYGTNQVLTAGATSANATISFTSKQLRVVNTGTNKAYFRTYDARNGVQAATTADCVVAPGMSTTVTKDHSHNGFSYISAAGTTLEIMTGEGF